MRLLLVAALLALSGCFGIPAGSADFGDRIVVRVVALDADSGEPLLWALGSGDQLNAAQVRSQLQSRLGGVPPSLQGELGGESIARDRVVEALREDGQLAAVGRQLDFVLGEGESGLGFQLERELIGRQPNETFTFVSRDDRSRGYTDTVTVPRLLEPQQIEQSLPQRDFEQILGPPQIGQRFDYNVLHQAEVVAVDNGTVRFRVLAEEGQSTEAGIVGATLVTRLQEETFRYELVPHEGERFVIQPPSPTNPQTPLGLQPGAYQVVGVRGDDIVYRYSAGAPQLAGRDVAFHVEVLSVERVEPQAPEGNYGVRRSPVLPHLHVEEDHDDHGGHDDHDHGSHEH